MTFNDTISKYQSHILLLTGIIFLPFIIYFLTFEFFIPFYIEIVVLLFFVLSYILVNKGFNQAGLVISITTFIFNSCIGIYFFGSEYGSQYLLLVINVFLSGNRRSSRVLNLFSIILIFALYLIFTVYFTYNPSIYKLPVNHLHIFRQVNIVLAFSFLALSFYIYSVLLENAEKEIAESHLNVFKMAHTDTLTDIPNRRSIEDELEKLIPCKKEGCKGLSIALADIDYFKNINDTYGHKAGDEVIKELASRFKKVVRSSDFVGRWGGEEFIFILKDTDHSLAFDTIERIRKKVQSQHIHTPEGEIKITLTFGLTNCTSSDTETSVFKRVDNNLYSGKQQGRDRTIYD